MINKLQFNKQSGFTLVEIIVSTAIFVVVMVAMLGLLTQTLQINRRVQANRELVQGSRIFTETIAKEVRNGRIDYDSPFNDCDPVNYTEEINQSLAILTRSGDRLCFYLSANGSFYLKKQTTSGQYIDSVFDANRFKINPDTFRFYVNPQDNPDPDTSGPSGCVGCIPGIQPSVTVVAQFELTAFTNSTSKINYQTTISTDVYDIPHNE